MGFFSPILTGPDRRTATQPSTEFKTPSTVFQYFLATSSSDAGYISLAILFLDRITEIARKRQKGELSTIDY